MVNFNRTGLLPIGLHLDHASVLLIQLEQGSPKLRCRAAAHAPLPEGEQADHSRWEEQVASLLRGLVKDHRFKGSRVVSSLGSRELFVQNMRLPQLDDDELENVIRFEAEERLPYPVAEAEVRFLKAAEVRQDASTKQEVILLACRRQQLESHIRVLELAGLRPAAIDVEPCAVLRCLREIGRRGPTGKWETETEAVDSRSSPPNRRPDATEPLGSASPRAYLNLTGTATTVMFAEGDRILFLKDVAFGGNTLDEAVARHLDLQPAEAAAMRRSVMTASELDPGNELHRSVIGSIRDPLSAIASEIELCFRYYKVTFRGKPIDKMLICGSEGSPWLVEFLAEQLGTPCELADPFAALGGVPASAPQPWHWTVAMGLAMRSLEAGREQRAQMAAAQ